MARLDGKIAIVTGGTSGIGAHTAKVFSDEGAIVVFCGRRADRGEKIAAELGDRVEFIQTDVTVEAEVAHLVKETVRRHGRLDVMFNNAGGPAPTGSIIDLDMPAFRDAMDVLVTNVAQCMKHAAPVMKDQGSGSIINNGSVAGHQAGWSSSMTYSGAKAAVIHLTRCVAMELAESGVRVNSISPGGVATGIFGKAFGLDEDKAEQTVDMIKQAMANMQPIKRAGLPEDIAQAAVFLASDDSTFISARDIVVDGGLLGGRQWSAHQQAMGAMKAAFDAI
jgi:NAD(P)-dependent dehydrogenase (short-subunit alcohol dehydrogenase family)